MKTRFLRRIICLILTLCTVLSIFPVTAFATHRHGSEPAVYTNEDMLHTFGALVFGMAEKSTSERKLFETHDEREEPEVKLVEFDGNTDLMAIRNDGRTFYTNGCLIHTWGDWVTTKEPTCLTKGEEVRSCTKCGKTKSREMATVAHTAKDSYSILASATCTANGTRVKYCRWCSYICVSETISALGHSWGKYSTVKEATCTSTGTERRSCGRCGRVETRDIDKVAHQTYTITGKEEFECCEVIYYTRTKCSVCGASIGYVSTRKAVEHNVGDWQVTEEATCLTSGKKERQCTKCGLTMDSATIPPLGHSMKVSETQEATCMKAGYIIKTCRWCPFVEKIEGAPPTGHSAGEWYVTEEATCLTEGKKVQKCTKCSKELASKPIGPLGHSLGDYVIIKEATCTRTGEETQICSSCNGQFNTRNIAKAPHKTYTIEKRIELGMCEVEYRIEKKCRNCSTEFGALISRTTEHTPGETKVIGATCETDGVIQRFCKECNLLYLTTPGDPAFGHGLGDYVVIKKATCTQTGEEAQICSSCNGRFNTRSIAKLPHDTYTIEKRIDLGMCEVEYRIEKKCRNCSTEFGALISRTTEHTLSDYVTVREATCTQTGEEAQICSICKEKINVRSIGKLPHDTFTVDIRKELGMCVVEYRTEKKCRNCTTELGASIYRATEHVFGMPSIEAPTCTEDGYSIRSCKHCPFEARTPGEPALGHAFGATRRVEPTCDKDGYIESFCANCSKWIEVEELIVRPPHDTYAVTNRREMPECIVYYETWMRCHNCSWESSYCAVKKEAEHTPGDAIVTEATCTEAGVVRTYCVDCRLCLNEKEGDPPTGHAVKEVIVKHAYCDVEGEKAYVCEKMRRSFKNGKYPCA